MALLVFPDERAWMQACGDARKVRLSKNKLKIIWKQTPAFSENKSNPAKTNLNSLVLISDSIQIVSPSDLEILVWTQMKAKHFAYRTLDSTAHDPQSSSGIARIPYAQHIVCVEYAEYEVSFPLLNHDWVIITISALSGCCKPCRSSIYCRYYL